MTKTLKSGEDNKMEGDWYASSHEVKSEPLRDSGTGKPIILRVFEFSADPISLKRERPSKQQLFNSHANQIKMMLWGDGLEPIEVVSPKVVVSKKKEKYRIFVTCQPKVGVALTDKPLTLQELTKKNAT